MTNDFLFEVKRNTGYMVEEEPETTWLRTLSWFIWSRNLGPIFLLFHKSLSDMVLEFGSFLAIYLSNSPFQTNQIQLSSNTI